MKFLHFEAQIFRTTASANPETKTIELVRNDIGGHIVHKLFRFFIVKSGR